MRSLLVSSLVLSLSRAGGVGLQALTLFFLAHALPIEDVGYVGLVYAGLGIVRYLAPLGTDVIALRRIARESAGAASAEAQAISLASLALTALVGISAAAISVGLLTGVFTVSGLEAVAIVAAIPAFALMGAFAGQIRGFGRNLAAQLPEALGLHVVFGSLIVLLAVLGDLQREQVLACLALAGWGVVAVYAVVRARIGWSWTGWPAAKALVALAREGLALSQSLALTALTSRVPTLLAAVLAGPAGAALIDLASRIGRLPEITTSGVSATLSPEFAKRAEPAQRLRVLRRGSVLAALPALCWALVIAIFGEQLIALILPVPYHDIYVPLVLVALAVAVNASFGLAGTLLLMTDQESRLRNFALAQFIVLCLVSVLSAPLLGSAGVALGILLGSLARDGGSMLDVIARSRGEVPLAAGTLVR